jgi:hypothetical protein
VSRGLDNNNIKEKGSAMKKTKTVYVPACISSEDLYIILIICKYNVIFLMEGEGGGK